jgi:hypothetical protein
MKQGRASRDSGTSGRASVGAYNYGREGGKVEPRPNVYRPGGVAQIGNMVGDHVTSSPRGTDYRGDPLHGGRGFKAPPVKSQSSNRGSQGKY